MMNLIYNRLNFDHHELMMNLIYKIFARIVVNHYIYLYGQ